MDKDSLQSIAQSLVCASIDLAKLTPSDFLSALDVVRINNDIGSAISRISILLSKIR